VECNLAPLARFNFLVLIEITWISTMIYSFPVDNSGGPLAVLTIAGSDSSGGAGIQVLAVGRPKVPVLGVIADLYTVGRPENIYGSGMLWDVCRNSTNRAEHEEGTGRLPRTVLVR
jgi:hypothetical protein